MKSLAGGSIHTGGWPRCIPQYTRFKNHTSVVVCASNGTRASTPAAAARAAESSSKAYSYILPRQVVAMFASGAVLGPFCDGFHSQHDVLHYVHPSLQLQLRLGSLQWSFETCWWVPLLFGVAGVILGVSVPLLDNIMQQPNQQQQPQQQAAPPAAAGQQTTPVVYTAGTPQSNLSWPNVMLCIALFVLQYKLSGVLEQPTLGQNLGPTPFPVLDILLLTYAVAHWYTFDRTPQGFGMSALTAVCGPLVEVLLINGFGLYSYSHPVVLGVPTWIPWVYFCGGPAVGNLGRKVWQELTLGYDHNTRQ